MAFDWGKNTPPTESFGVNSDESDALDGLDAEVAPEDAKWLTEDRKRLAQIAAAEVPQKAKESVKQQPVMDRDTLGMIGLNDFDLPEEDDQLSEVEFRLEKAQCYKMLINHQLLSGDTEAAKEVEVEVQDFVRERLGDLMGMSKPAQGPAPVSEPIFSDDEVAALKAVASKVLGRPAIVAPAPQSTPQRAPVPAPVPRPAAVMPAPSPMAPVKRGRGRPRKYPIEATPQAEPVKAEAKPKPVDGSIEVLPDGTRIRVVGNRRYKLVKKPVLYKDGTVGEEEFEFDATPRQKPAGAKPYPSEAEVAALATTEAAVISSQRSNLVKAATAVSIAQQTQKGIEE